MSTAKSSVADAMLAIIEAELVQHTVKFLAVAGQTITKEQAGNIVRKVGLRMEIRYQQSFLNK